MGRHLINCKLSMISILVLALIQQAYSELETPIFTVLISKPDIEIRLYEGSTWLLSPVQEYSFDMATKQGFHRIYQYMRGANQNSTKLNFTAPILTSINPKTGGFGDYNVMFYLPKEYENSPPLPNPDLNLQFTKWASHCIAIRKFIGYAKDDNIVKEKSTLVNSLNDLIASGNPPLSEEDLPYVIAQYTAPFNPNDRLNEVWLNVSGLHVNGCP